MSKGSKPYDPEFIEAVKQAYLSSNDSLAAIAKQFNIGQRTVEGWCSEGGWSDLRKAQKVVPISEGKKKAQTPKPKPSLQSPPESTHNNPVSIRARRQQGQIDEVEIVESAIAYLSLLLGGTAGLSAYDEEARPVDTRGIGGIAGALVRMLEYRRKICPPTAAELAEQAIALGMSPQEFVAELKVKWQLKERA